MLPVRLTPRTDVVDFVNHALSHTSQSIIADCINKLAHLQLPNIEAVNKAPPNAQQWGNKNMKERLELVNLAKKVCNPLQPSSSVRDMIEICFPSNSPLKSLINDLQLYLEEEGATVKTLLAALQDVDWAYRGDLQPADINLLTQAALSVCRTTNSTGENTSNTNTTNTSSNATPSIISANSPANTNAEIFGFYKFSCPLRNKWWSFAPSLSFELIKKNGKHFAKANLLPSDSVPMELPIGKNYFRWKQNNQIVLDKQKEVHIDEDGEIWNIVIVEERTFKTIYFITEENYSKTQPCFVFKFFTDWFIKPIRCGEYVWMVDKTCITEYNKFITEYNNHRNPQLSVVTKSHDKDTKSENFSLTSDNSYEVFFKEGITKLNKPIVDISELPISDSIIIWQNMKSKLIGKLPMANTLTGALETILSHSNDFTKLSHHRRLFFAVAIGSLLEEHKPTYKKEFPQDWYIPYFKSLAECSSNLDKLGEHYFEIKNTVEFLVRSVVPRSFTWLENIEFIKYYAPQFDITKGWQTNAPDFETHFNRLPGVSRDPTVASFIIKYLNYPKSKSYIKSAQFPDYFFTVLSDLNPTDCKTITDDIKIGLKQCAKFWSVGLKTVQISKKFLQNLMMDVIQDAISKGEFPDEMDAEVFVGIEPTSIIQDIFQKMAKHKSSKPYNCVLKYITVCTDLVAMTNVALSWLNNKYHNFNNCEEWLLHKWQIVNLVPLAVREKFLEKLASQMCVIFSNNMLLLAKNIEHKFNDSMIVQFYEQTMCNYIKNLQTIGSIKIFSTQLCLDKEIPTKCSETILLSILDKAFTEGYDASSVINLNNDKTWFLIFGSKKNNSRVLLHKLSNSVKENVMEIFSKIVDESISVKQLQQFFSLDQSGFLVDLGVIIFQSPELNLRTRLSEIRQKLNLILDNREALQSFIARFYPFLMDGMEFRKLMLEQPNQSLRNFGGKDEELQAIICTARRFRKVFTYQVFQNFSKVYLKEHLKLNKLTVYQFATTVAPELMDQFIASSARFFQENTSHVRMSHWVKIWSGISPDCIDTEISSLERQFEYKMNKKMRMCLRFLANFEVTKSKVKSLLGIINTFYSTNLIETEVTSDSDNNTKETDSYFRKLTEYKLQLESNDPEVHETTKVVREASQWIKLIGLEDKFGIWELIEKIQSLELIKFLCNTKDEDFRALINVVEDLADQNVSEKTVADLISVKDFLKDFLQTKWTEKNLIKKLLHSTCTAEFLTQIENCVQNISALTYLYQNLANRGDITKNIIASAVKSGKFIFSLSQQKNSLQHEPLSPSKQGLFDTQEQVHTCVLELQPNTSNVSVTKKLNMDDMLDYQSRAMLIVNSEKKGGTFYTMEGKSTLTKFIHLVDLAQAISSSLLYLQYKGYYDFVAPNFPPLTGETMLREFSSRIEQSKAEWDDILTKCRQMHSSLTFVRASHLSDIYNYLSNTEGDLPHHVLSLFKFIHNSFNEENIPHIRTIFTKFSTLISSPRSLYDKVSTVGKTLDEAVKSHQTHLRVLPACQWINSTAFTVIPGKTYIGLSKSKDLQFNLVMSLYLNQGYFPFPSEIIWCNSSTTWEDIELLLLRCFNSSNIKNTTIEPPESTTESPNTESRNSVNLPLNNKTEAPLFCIAGVESLSFALQSKLIDVVRRQENSLNSGWKLALVCEGGQQKQMDYFGDRMTEPEVITNGVLKNIYTQFRPGVQVITSTSPGLGKTHKIRSMARLLKSRLIPFPISGTIDLEVLVNRLCALQISRNFQHALHLDISLVDSIHDLNKFLFELIIVGMVKGRMLFHCPEIEIFVEVANTLNNYLAENIHFATTLQSTHIEWNDSELIVSLEKSSPIQVVCHYLHHLDTKTIGSTSSEKIEVVGPDRCIELLHKYFFTFLAKNEIPVTFITLNIFLEIFGEELKCLGYSGHFKVSTLERTTSKLIVRELLVQALLEVSRQFACKSLNSVRSSQHASQLKIVEAMVDRVNNLQKWSSDNQLIIMFNTESIQSISVLYRDPATVPTIIKEFLITQSATRSSFVMDDLRSKEPSDLQTRLYRIACSRCPPAHINNHYDTIQKYALTVDNLLKMALILARIRVRIPVIVMGDTGCGKTSLISYLALVVGADLLVLNINAGTTQSKIIQFVNDGNRKALGGGQQVWLFFDEINTCSHLGLLNDIICHRHIFGKPLHKSMVLLAACNPYKRKEHTSITAGLQANKQAFQSLVYNVNPLPETMLAYVWDFGTLSDADEAALVNTMVKALPVEFHKHLKIIAELITFSQAFLRKADTPSSVSMRDVNRTISLITWFYTHMAQPSEEKPKWAMAVVLGHALCYYAKISNRTVRADYATGFDSRFWTKAGVKGSFKEVLRLEQESYLKEITCEKGIAKNGALLENVFVVLVCILNRIPVFLVGKPGCSKSLAIRIITDNLRGQDSKNEFFKKLARVFIVPYQGSESSTSGGIMKVFESAHKLLKDGYDQIIPVVLLDEVGLAEQSKYNPLKVLHSLLDPGFPKVVPDVAVVGISNWALDAAKMNRAIHISCLDPSEQDLIETGTTIVKELGHEQRFDMEITAIAKVYLKYSSIEDSHFHGLRDYYSAIKCLSVRGTMTAAQRNFGGKKENLFVKYLAQELSSSLPSSIPVNELISENLKDPNSRHLLLITKGDSALSLVNHTITQHTSHVPYVMFGSLFPNDMSEQYSYRMLSMIILCMETGACLVLKNFDQIYGSLYDMLNKNYTLVGAIKHCRIALGAHINPMCAIHDKFKCVVLIDENQADIADRPFLSRFEKQLFTYEDVMTVTDKELANELLVWVSAIRQLQEDSSTGDLASTVAVQKKPQVSKQIFTCGNDATNDENTFIGFSKNTLFSLVLSVSDLEKTKAVCKLKLMDVMTSDGLIRLGLSKLNHQDKAEVNLLTDHYTKNLVENFPSFVNKNKQNIDAGHQKYLIITFSNISAQFELPIPTQIEKLQVFKSENEFSGRLSHFWSPASLDNLLVLHCDTHTDHQHLLMAKFMMERHMHQYYTAREGSLDSLIITPTTTNTPQTETETETSTITAETLTTTITTTTTTSTTTITTTTETLEKNPTGATSATPTIAKSMCIVLHVHRDSLGSGWQLDYLWNWNQILIETLQPQNCVSLQDLLSDFSMHDIAKTPEFDMITIIKNSLVQAFHSVNYSNVPNTAEWINEAVNFIANNSKFLQMLKSKILSMLVFVPQDWREKVAFDLEKIQIYGAFQKALLREIEQYVCLALERVIRWLESHAAIKTYIFLQTTASIPKLAVENLVLMWEKMFSTIQIPFLSDDNTSSQLLSYWDLSCIIRIPFLHWIHTQFSIDFKAEYLSQPETNEDESRTHALINNSYSRFSEPSLVSIAHKSPQLFEFYMEDLLSIVLNRDISHTLLPIARKVLESHLSNSNRSFATIHCTWWQFRNLIESQIEFIALCSKLYGDELITTLTATTTSTTVTATTTTPISQFLTDGNFDNFLQQFWSDFLPSFFLEGSSKKFNTITTPQDWYRNGSELFPLMRKINTRKTYESMKTDTVILACHDFLGAILNSCSVADQKALLGEFANLIQSGDIFDSALEFTKVLKFCDKLPNSIGQAFAHQFFSKCLDFMDNVKSQDIQRKFEMVSPMIQCLFQPQKYFAGETKTNVVTAQPVLCRIIDYSNVNWEEVLLENSTTIDSTLTNTIDTFMSEENFELIDSEISVLLVDLLQEELCKIGWISGISEDDRRLPDAIANASTILKEREKSLKPTKLYCAVAFFKALWTVIASEIRPSIKISKEFCNCLQVELRGLLSVQYSLLKTIHQKYPLSRVQELCKYLPVPWLNELNWEPVKENFEFMYPQYLEVKRIVWEKNEEKLGAFCSHSGTDAYKTLLIVASTFLTKDCGPESNSVSRWLIQQHKKLPNITELSPSHYWCLSDMSNLLLSVLRHLVVVISWQSDSVLFRYLSKTNISNEVVLTLDNDVTLLYREVLFYTVMKNSEQFVGVCNCGMKYMFASTSAFLCPDCKTTVKTTKFTIESKMNSSNKPLLGFQMQPISQLDNEFIFCRKLSPIFFRILHLFVYTTLSFTECDEIIQRDFLAHIKQDWKVLQNILMCKEDELCTLFHNIIRSMSTHGVMTLYSANLNEETRDYWEQQFVERTVPLISDRFKNTNWNLSNLGEVELRIGEVGKPPEQEFLPNLFRSAVCPVPFQKLQSLFWIDENNVKTFPFLALFFLMEQELYQLRYILPLVEWSNTVIEKSSNKFLEAEVKPMKTIDFLNNHIDESIRDTLFLKMSSFIDAWNGATPFIKTMTGKEFIHNAPKIVDSSKSLLDLSLMKSKAPFEMSCLQYESELFYILNFLANIQNMFIQNTQYLATCGCSALNFAGFADGITRIRSVPIQSISASHILDVAKLDSLQEQIKIFAFNWPSRGCGNRVVVNWEKLQMYIARTLFGSGKPYIALKIKEFKYYEQFPNRSNLKTLSDIIPQTQITDTKLIESTKLDAQQLHVELDYILSLVCKMGGEASMKLSDYCTKWCLTDLSKKDEFKSVTLGQLKSFYEIVEDLTLDELKHKCDVQYKDPLKDQEKELLRKKFSTNTTKYVLATQAIKRLIVRFLRFPKEPEFPPTSFLCKHLELKHLWGDEILEPAVLEELFGSTKLCQAYLTQDTLMSFRKPKNSTDISQVVKPAVTTKTQTRRKIYDNT